MVPRPTLFRSAFLFAVIAATGPQIAHQSGLEKWGAISAIVAGVVAALLFVGGLLRWAWQRSRRPRLVVGCGAGFDFEKRVGNTDSMVKSSVEHHSLLGAYGKFLRVEETRGKLGARSVVLRVTDVHPPPPHTKSAVELRWADNTEATAIRPSGHKNAVLQLMIFYRAGDSYSGAPGFRATPTVFEHADVVTFTVELLVEGRKYSATRFRMVNEWSNEAINLWDDEPWPPDESDVVYSTVNGIPTRPPRWSPRGWFTP